MIDNFRILRNIIGKDLLPQFSLLFLNVINQNALLKNPLPFESF